MKLYKHMIEGLLQKFKEYEVHHIPRAENKEANIASKLALSNMH